MNALINKTIVTIYGKPQFDDSSNPEATSTIQDEGLYGMPVEILEQINTYWVKIRTYYKYEGYVPIGDLYLMTEDEILNRKDENLRFVIKGFADILSLPKVQGIKLLQVSRGTVLTYVSQEDGWAKVKLNDGRMGYIKEGFLGTYYSRPSSDKEEAFREKVVETAKQYMGTQYRWGGKSPLGIDCSGLCSMAYLLNGVIIFRDAQIKEEFPVHKIDYKDRKKGDLLYFPGHIAMYLGDDYYIHSTGKNGSDGVVINSLNPKDPLYRDDLVKSLYAVGSIF